MVTHGRVTVMPVYLLRKCRHGKAGDVVNAGQGPIGRLGSLAASRIACAAMVATLLVQAALSPVAALAAGGAVPARDTAAPLVAAATVASAAPSGEAALATPTPAPSIVPTASAVAAATRWIRGRKGVVGFAVVDSAGHLSGYHMNTRFMTASVVKAMLLVGYLRTHRTVGTWARSTLTKMIHVSDNNAATAIYKIVGDAGLRAVAKAAHMRNFSVSGSWGTALLTPADQARFFYGMDALVPAGHVGFARYLLSHITPAHAWGIPATARPHGWTVFFKGGCIGTARGRLVHQVARLEQGGVKFAVAIMTDGDPSQAYGIGTLRGVTQRLLGLAH
jgi:hypothetical protein